MENDSDNRVEQIGRWLWDNKAWVIARLADIRRWLFPPAEEGSASNILIIGPGGVGKTTFAQLFSGKYDSPLEVPGVYEESIDLERYTLEDDPSIELIVPPGQRHRRDATWTELEKSIGAGAFRGIIVVASYGYHSLGEISYKDHRLYRGDDAVFLANFLRECRGDEVGVIRRLAPHIRGIGRKSWILTLVTKQDLWWHECAEAESFYRAGEYGTIIDEVVGHLGQSRLRHEFAFTSLVISNFTTGRNEVLARTIAGYDQIQSVKSLRRLWEIFDALKKWEERG